MAMRRAFASSTLQLSRNRFESVVSSRTIPKFIAVFGTRAFATSSSSSEKVHCLNFDLRESDAVASFEEWTTRYAPTGDSSVVFDGCTPALLPFFVAKNIDVYMPATSRKPQRLDEDLAQSGSNSCYGGRIYSRHIAEAAKPLKVQDYIKHRAPSSLAAMSSGGNSPDRIEVDTWSIWGSNATDLLHRQIRKTLAEKYQISDDDENIRVEIEKLEKYMVPAYVFTYSRKGQSWNVVVGAISGRATGLIQFGLWDGIKTTAKDVASVARTVSRGQLPPPSTILWAVLLVLPRLVPPVGAAFLVISALRALLVPSLVNLFTSRRVNMDTNSEWIERAADAFGSQWGTYDPNNKEETFSFGDTNYRESFLNWQKRQQEEAQRFSEDFQRRVQDEEERARRGQRSSTSSSSSSSGSRQQQHSSRQQQQSQPAKSAYEVLGIPRTASQADISKAYRRKLLLWHPDQNLGKANQEECARNTQAIVAAYRELKSK